MTGHKRNSKRNARKQNNERGQYIEHAFNLYDTMPTTMTVKDVKVDLGRHLKVPSCNLQVHYNGKILDDKTILLYNGLAHFPEANVGDKRICFGLTVKRAGSDEIEEIDIDLSAYFVKKF